MNTWWRGLVSGLVLLLAVCGVSGCKDRVSGHSQATSLPLYGNVDIREVQLAFEDGGRISSLFVDEGARVKAGQMVAALDPQRFQFEVDRLTSEVAAQAETLTRMRNGSRPQEIEKAKAALDATKAELKEARLNFDRKQVLLVTNRISQQEVDSAKARVESLEAASHAAADELSLVTEGPRREDISAAEAKLQALNAARDLAKRRQNDSRLLAPADGIIRNRILETGAMAAPGAPVFTLALTNPLWVRAYVNEPDLGKIREGMAVQIHTDSYPDKAYQGWLGFISSTAEFTPKTVETTELRTKLVYRARILACDPGNELRQGMPVTVNVDTKAPVSTNPVCGP